MSAQRAEVSEDEYLRLFWQQLYADYYRAFGQRVVVKNEVAVGQSAREVIWSYNKTSLYYYLPAAKTKNRYPVPLLVIYSLINKPYVLDLLPETSLIGFLLREGFEVYLLDWGEPGLEDAGMLLDEYVLDLLPQAVKKTLRHSKALEISVLGYCLGGTLLACSLAICPQLPVRNLILMAAPLDFSERGLLQVWLTASYFDVRRIVEAYRLIPAELINFGTQLLKPGPTFFSGYNPVLSAFPCNKGNLSISRLAINKWVNDGIAFPGAAFQQLVEELYRRNNLVKGELVLRSKKVQLANIKANLLNIIAAGDHIALPSQCQPVMQLTQSPDKTQVVLPGGHVGIVIGRNASVQLWPVLESWLPVRST